MLQSRERLLAFVLSVALCSMMSGSLSLIAKRSRDESTVATRTTRLIAPHDALLKPPEGGVRSDSGTSFDESVDIAKPFKSQNEMKSTVPTTQPIGGNFGTAGILCLCAVMCCAVTTVVGLILLRGRRGDSEYLSEEDDSDRAVLEMKRGKQKTSEKTTKRAFQGYRLIGDEVDEITPQEAV